MLESLQLDIYEGNLSSALNNNTEGRLCSGRSTPFNQLHLSQEQHSDLTQPALNDIVPTVYVNKPGPLIQIFSNRQLHLVKKKRGLKRYSNCVSLI